MTNQIEANGTNPSIQGKTPKKSCELYAGVSLVAIGIILTLGGLSVVGLYVSRAFPHLFQTIRPIPSMAAPVAAGFTFICLGSLLFIKYKEKCLRVADENFPNQAKSNLCLALQSHSCDPRRFNVLGTAEHPILQKVGLPRYLMRRIFNARKEASSSLRDALDQSAKAIDENSNEILFSKYQRFIRTTSLFQILSQDESEPQERGNNSREWGHFDRTVKENHDDLTQPIYKNGKWYHMQNQANHGIEAFVIFVETQLKRLGRLLSFNTCCKYFSKNESDEDIYELQQPQLHTEEPIVQNVGHATLLFQMGRINILTDPTFGGLNPVFYPRKTKPGLTADELPPIDVVLISHNHRDHCDIDSLKKLVPHQPVILVPKGDFNRFRDLGFTNVQEHEWWTTTTISCNGETVDFHAVPARHWSGTGAFDLQQSLICSWVFKRQQDKGAVYFRGDTANIPTKTMEEIVAFTQAPIMANFEPGGPNHRRRWMESTHQSVLDSMLSAFEVSARAETCTTYLMHHNTFELGTDRFNEALIIKDQILTFLEESPLSTESASFNALPKFVQNELKSDALNRIQEIGIERFVSYIKNNFNSPKIGERMTLQLR